MKKDSQCSDADPGHLTAEGGARQGTLIAKSRALAGALSPAKDSQSPRGLCLRSWPRLCQHHSLRSPPFAGTPAEQGGSLICLSEMEAFGDRRLGEMR